jgi:F-box interacting protein
MICNPATREFVTLPKPKRKHYEYTSPRAGFGFDPCTNKYKVARFFYRKLRRRTGRCKVVCKFEVLTLGTTNTWRQTADPPYWIDGQTPVHVNGYIYWTCCGKDFGLERPPDLFLGFSLTDDKFSLVPFPPSGLKPARFVELDSQLCCLCFSFQKLEIQIWTLDDCRPDHDPKWSRRWSTGISFDLVAELPLGLALRPPRVVLHQETWLLAQERNVYRFDAKACEIEKISSGAPDIRYYYDPTSRKAVVLHLTNYVESLVQIG